MAVRERSSSSLAGPGDLDRTPVWLQAVLAALGAAAVSAGAVAAVAVAAWPAGPGTTTGVVDAMRVGLDVWLLAQGVPLRVGEGSVSLVPWLLTLVPFATLWWAARRLAAGLPARPDRGGVRVAGVSFVGTYALAAALVGFLASSEALAPALVPGLLGPVALALLAGALALRGARPAPRDGEPVRLWGRQIPAWLRSAVGPAARGVLVLGVLGALAVLVLLAVTFPRVQGLYAVLQAGAVGTAVLTLAQLCYLPTFAAWAVAFAAGPGFAVGAGSSIGWGGADPGLLPLVPVLGALPDPGPLPGWYTLSVAVPVLVGAGIGRACLRRAGAEASVLGRLRAAAAGAGLAAVFATVVIALSTGSLGSGRLAQVGPHPFLVGAALLGEFLGGALLVALVSLLRVRRPGGSAEAGRT